MQSRRSKIILSNQKLIVPNLITKCGNEKFFHALLNRTNEVFDYMATCYKNLIINKFFIRILLCYKTQRLTQKQVIDLFKTTNAEGLTLFQATLKNKGSIAHLNEAMKPLEIAIGLSFVKLESERLKAERESKIDTALLKLPGLTFLCDSLVNNAFSRAPVAFFNRNPIEVKKACSDDKPVSRNSFG
jgi:hypothetical protein